MEAALAGHCNVGERGIQNRCKFIGMPLFFGGKHVVKRRAGQWWQLSVNDVFAIEIHHSFLAHKIKHGLSYLPILLVFSAYSQPPYGPPGQSYQCDDQPELAYAV